MQSRQQSGSLAFFEQVLWNKLTWLVRIMSPLLLFVSDWARLASFYCSEINSSDYHSILLIPLETPRACFKDNSFSDLQLWTASLICAPALIWTIQACNMHVILSTNCWSAFELTTDPLGCHSAITQLPTNQGYSCTAKLWVWVHSECKPSPACNFSPRVLHQQYLSTTLPRPLEGQRHEL